MKKREAYLIGLNAKAIHDTHFKEEKVRLTNSVVYAVGKTAKTFAGIVKEYEELKEENLKIWKKDYGFVEKDKYENKEVAYSKYLEAANEAYRVFVNSDGYKKSFEDLDNEETTISVHKVDPIELENCVASLEVISWLEDNLVNL